MFIKTHQPATQRLLLRDTRCFAGKMRSRWIHVLASFSRPGPDFFNDLSRVWSNLSSDPVYLGHLEWPSLSIIWGTLEEKITTNGISSRAS